VALLVFLAARNVFGTSISDFVNVDMVAAKDTFATNKAMSLTVTLAPSLRVTAVGAIEILGGLREYTASNDVAGKSNCCFRATLFIGLDNRLSMIAKTRLAFSDIENATYKKVLKIYFF